MSNGFGTIAGIIGGYKAGQLSESAANKLLRELGCPNEITSLVSLGVGIATGIYVGDIVSDAVSNIFEDLF